MRQDLFELSLFSELQRLVDRAFEEDAAFNDLTTIACIDPLWQASGAIVAKQAGVVAGLRFLPWIFRTFDPGIETILYVPDGTAIAEGQILCHAEGSATSLLSVERTALNLVQQLSGVASLTRRCKELVAGTACRILDTRKTVPGMRYLQKYAVSVGGGENQRMHLSDRILIKNNHLFLADRVSKHSMTYCLERAKQRYPDCPIQVEISSAEDLDIVLAAGAESVLLDNMDLSELSLCVRINNKRAFLEASGGITLETLRQVAETGVDGVSMGALTHSAPAMDLAMRIT